MQNAQRWTSLLGKGARVGTEIVAEKEWGRFSMKDFYAK
jgi:hypothetical protein